MKPKKPKPILMSSLMVTAIQEGRKTQTRRIVKPQPLVMDKELSWAGPRPKAKKAKGSIMQWPPDLSNFALHAAPIQPGDILWVRETFYSFGRWIKTDIGKTFIYAAPQLESVVSFSPQTSQPDNLRHTNFELKQCAWYKRPSLFMPFAAARIFLKVTGVKVERLQDISYNDCIAEGWTEESNDLIPKVWYENLWIKLNGPDSWQLNPWVWAYTFEKCGKPAATSPLSLGEGSGVRTKHAGEVLKPTL